MAVLEEKLRLYVVQDLGQIVTNMQNGILYYKGVVHPYPFLELSCPEPGKLVSDKTTTLSYSPGQKVVPQVIDPSMTDEPPRPSTVLGRYEITRSEFDRLVQEYKNAQRDYSTAVRHTHGGWQGSIDEAQAALAELESRRDQAAASVRKPAIPDFLPRAR